MDPAQRVHYVSTAASTKTISSLLLSYIGIALFKHLSKVRCAIRHRQTHR